MNSDSSIVKQCKRLAIDVILCCLSVSIAFAIPQQSEAESSRRFWPPNFRPAAATHKAKPKIAKYRRTTPALSQEASTTSGGIYAATRHEPVTDTLHLPPP